MKPERFYIEMLNNSKAIDSPDNWLYKVPGIQELAINRNGVCYNTKKEQFIELSNSHLFNPSAFFCVKRKRKYFRVDYLLAKTFVETYPEGYSVTNTDGLVVRRKDGTRGNNKVDNLYWAIKDEIILLEQIVNYDDILVQVPSIPFLAVSRSGLVKNISTGYLLTPKPDHDGYVRIKPAFKGVPHAFVLHRLFAEVFIPPKEGYTIEQCLKELEVNHKDGNKSNNRLTNLEWVTGSENIKHAIDTGLLLIERACILRNVITNEITRFISISALSAFLNMSITYVAIIIKSPKAGCRLRYDYVFKLDDGLPWPDAIFVDNYDNLAFRKAYVIIYNDNSRRISYVKRDARDLLNCSFDLFPDLGLVQIKNFKLLVVLEPLYETFRNTHLTQEPEILNKRIEINDTSRGKVFTVFTLREASMVFGLPLSSLQERIKINDIVVNEHLILQVLDDIINT